jgi:DNA-directed RNA polymerase specialized sigma54-like protein
MFPMPVRRQIKILIDDLFKNENRDYPLCDNEVAEYLSAALQVEVDDQKVFRYREKFGIAAWHQRRKDYAKQRGTKCRK